MIRLKQLLTEDSPKISNLFGRLVYDSTLIPLSIPIIKKLVGNIKTAKVAHITDYNGYQKLKKLEGKKKGISSFNKLGSKSWVSSGSGIATDGGVMVILEGKLLLNSDWDLYSVTDSQGRKWVEIKRILDDKHQFKMEDVLPKEAQEIRDRYLFPNKERPKITQQEKKEFIEMYIDTATKELLKRKNVFQDKYFSESDYLDNDWAWNEIIVAQMKIKEVAFVENVGQRRKGWETDKNFKLPNNGVIIDTKDVPVFLKKHSIKIK